MTRYEYSPDSRADRLTAIGRVAVVLSSLVGVLLGAPVKHTYALAYAVTGYLLYSLVLYRVVLRSKGLADGQRLVTHAVDILSFSILFSFSPGPESPFVLGFVFAVACATLRWHWRGAMWTGLITVVLFVALSIPMSSVKEDPNRLAIRTTFLVVLSVVFVYLGAYQSHVRLEMQKLAAWPTVSGRDLAAVARETLPHAADILDAPSVAMVWDEPEEPGPQLAWWTGGNFRIGRERPGVLEPFVAPEISESDFLCRDLTARVPDVLHTAAEGLQHWRGAPLHGELAARFAMRSVLCVRLPGVGRLLFLDKPGLTTDDLRTGQIVALQMMSSLAHVRLLLSREEAAVAGERVRLAHDLHDGVLQSLTAVALQVEAIVQGIDTTPRQRLEQIQNRIVDEQRHLRYFIEHLKSPARGVAEDDSTLAERLDALTRRLDADWNLQVKLTAAGVDRVPGPLAHSVFFIVHEALINAARHARATTVEVDIAVLHSRIDMMVADNGRGFPFRGRHDSSTLNDMQLAPSTLHQRVTLLGGTLTIDSSDQGARLEISLPLQGTDD